jgi:hypothetical protein
LFSAVLAAAVPAAQRAPAQPPAPPRAKGPAFDFAPGKAGELLKAPSSVWTDINRFVFLIGFDFYAPGATNLDYATYFSKVDVYPELHRACRRWGTQTFSELQALAEELSRGEIPKLLTDLKAAVERPPADPGEAERAFARTADELNRKLTRLNSLTGSVQEDLNRLSDLTSGAIIQYRARQFPQERRLVQIGPSLDGVRSALKQMGDGWNSLSFKVDDLRKETKSWLGSKDKFDLAITIDVGLDTWTDVQRAAQRFVANVPAQRMYLTGENYYSDFWLSENRWYIIQCQAQERYNIPGSSDVIGASGAKWGMFRWSDDEWKRFPQGRPGSQAADIIALNGMTWPVQHPGDQRLMEWRIERMGRGWWRIINRGRGESEFLDVINDGSDERARSDPKNGYAPTMVRSHPGQFTGQWWRIVPSEDKNYVRLYNAFLGESRSLGYRSRRLPGDRNDRTPPPLSSCFMVPNEDVPEQRWRMGPTLD